MNVISLLLMFEFIQNISYSLFIMFIWFNTNAFVEYSKLFRLKKIFKVDKFEEWLFNNPGLKYYEFLSVKYRSFIIKLITCKPCFLFWIIIIIKIYDKNVPFIITYMTSYILYKILDKNVFR